MDIIGEGHLSRETRKERERAEGIPGQASSGGHRSVPGVCRCGSRQCTQCARLGFPGALPQRRVVWMWFGAFPGAVGLGRAQPQRRGV